MIFHRTARQTLDFIITRRPHLLLTKSHLNLLNRPLSHFSNLMSSKPTDVNSTGDDLKPIWYPLISFHIWMQILMSRKK